MISLGMTHGKRSMTAMKPMPEWILKGSMMVKREFLGGLFGGDGCKIQCNVDLSIESEMFGNLFKEQIIDKKRQNSFGCIKLSNVKDIKFEESLTKFMEKVDDMLHEFDIRTLDIKRDIAKYDSTKVKVGVKMSDSETNLINFFNKIGYRYDRTKLMESACSCEYLRYKRNNLYKIYYFTR